MIDFLYECPQALVALATKKWGDLQGLVKESNRRQKASL